MNLMGNEIGTQKVLQRQSSNKGLGIIILVAGSGRIRPWYKKCWLSI